MINRVIAMAVAVFALTAASPLFAQVGFPAPPLKTSPAQGAIDFHVHSEPDVFGRSMDDIDVAILAKRKGMRGLVLKNHVTMTADRAVLVMKMVPGIEIFGGIVLNNAVGGINPAAVEWMHRMSGGRGKVVWLPTFDSDMHIKTLVDPKGSGIEVAPGGVVTQPVEAVLKIIARENLVLATGHIHAEEVMAVVRRARGAGREKHPRHACADQHPRPDHGAGEGSRADGCVHRVLLPAVDDRAGRAARVDEALEEGNAEGRGERGRRIGANHVVLSTDLGQHANMTHPDGMEDMITGLLKEGVPQADVDLMVKTNPAKLLGLEEQD